VHTHNVNSWHIEITHMSIFSRVKKSTMKNP
jgi:hypothetical protein